MSYFQWIDTLQFENYGQWKQDTQFTHLMGSGYLLACHAPGCPVEDAVTRFQLPAAGHYRIWARARNWYYQYAPGKFTVLVDGKESGVVLGALPSNDWVWQIAGDFALDAGEHTLHLHDLTGYFGRCSSLIITDDMDFVPKRPVADFERQRADMLGISLEPVDEGSYDVIVAGGGPGGVPAALAAARMGSRVLLLTNRPILGGNASKEAGVGFNGASARQPNARDGGITEEMIRLKGRLGCSWTEVMQRLCDQEPLLEVRYNLHVCDAQVYDSTIESIVARHTINGTRHRFCAKQFIDCTGDAWLGYHAGAKYRIGREAHWQYDEPFAPEQPDLLTMSGTVMNLRMTDTGKPVAYQAPEWIVQLPEGKKFGRNIENIGMVWWAEAPNILDDIFDAELARDEIFRVYLAYFNYLKNLWDEKERAANYAFTFMNHMDAKRESRRLIGDYVVTQKDCMSGTVFADTVGHTGWPIDLHHPKGIYSGEEGPFFSNTHVPMASIPYRSLYSVNINNLLMAGRNISVSHVALGTARLQGTIANLGQAVGTAAALCIAHGLTPRQLGEKHIHELQQQLLRDDQYIPGCRSDDEKDLARICTVTASSESKGEPYVWRLGLEERLAPLDRQRATFLARGVSPEIPSVWLQLYNAADHPVKLTIHLREQADPDGYTTQEDLCSVTREVPGGGEHWVEFPVNLTIEKRYLWIWTDPVENLSWRILKYPPLDWTRSERTSPQEKFKNIRMESHSVSLIPPVVKTADCRADNVINGYSRDNGPENHLWASDEREGLPQWLELSLPSVHQISCVQLTFDTDMTNNAMLVPITAVPKQLVTDYTVEVRTGLGWEKVAEVHDNFQRHQVHRFTPVQADKVRVTVTGSGDGHTARIFEVRIYDEPAFSV